MRNFILIALLMFFTGKAKANDLMTQVNHFASCGAYALQRTAEYPETITIYQQGAKPLNDEQKSRADAGLNWTNRAWLIRQLLASAMQKRDAKVPTNGEVSGEIASWLRILNDRDALFVESIGTLCKLTFERATDHCRLNKCIDFIR